MLQQKGCFLSALSPISVGVPGCHLDRMNMLVSRACSLPSMAVCVHIHMCGCVGPCHTGTSARRKGHVRQLSPEHIWTLALVRGQPGCYCFDLRKFGDQEESKDKWKRYSLGWPPLNSEEGSLYYPSKRRLVCTLPSYPEKPLFPRTGTFPLPQKDAKLQP